jgi:pyruvate ferredoxin oxidoreductase alpha subunit
LQNYYFEFKKQQEDAMAAAMDVIQEIGKEYAELTGRSYGLIDAYRCDDADLVVVGLGSTMGTAKQAADELREQEGLKCGVLKIRSYRPFPIAAIRETLTGKPMVGVMDRSLSFGLGGPLFHEVRSALYGETSPMMDFIYGLGGRDLSLDDAKDVFRAMNAGMDKVGGEPVVHYVGLRE